MSGTPAVERRRPEFAALRRRWDEALGEVKEQERQTRRLFVRWIIFVLLALVSTTFFQYDQRYRSCERGKIDRTLSAQGWRMAEQTWRRVADDPRTTLGERQNALQASTTYGSVARSLEERTGSGFDCASTILPWN